jgi:hypothetical protein
MTSRILLNDLPENVVYIGAHITLPPPIQMPDWIKCSHGAQCSIAQANGQYAEMPIYFGLAKSGCDVPIRPHVFG